MIEEIIDNQYRFFDRRPIQSKTRGMVAALGNSLGLGISGTKGIFSAPDVSLSNSPSETLEDLIQTDAAINPGNSEGLLLDQKGRVIGINSAKVAEVSFEGMVYMP